MGKPEHFRVVEKNSCNNCVHIRGEWSSKDKDTKTYRYVCKKHKFSIRNGGHRYRSDQGGLDDTICDDHEYDTEMR